MPRLCFPHLRECCSYDRAADIYVANSVCAVLRSGKEELSGHKASINDVADPAPTYFGLVRFWWGSKSHAAHNFRATQYLLPTLAGFRSFSTKFILEISTDKIRPVHRQSPRMIPSLMIT